ncbi:MAG: GGDEF domain-containing protein, partial [Gemmatimonadota bacterium]|nr:GGDEF domain-containing protein [Gemmatimonadota bacterium]
ELRVFPLYYAPLAVLAWRSGRDGALVATVGCTASWVASNAWAGLAYSLTLVWIINTLMQLLSFLVVGLLIAAVRDALLREQGRSRTDPLTAMLNRAGFYEEAARLVALCRRTGRPVTVAYIDLDNFKAVNDSLGHEAGDDVLRTVAGLLRVAIRPSDVAARLGGDEFVVLFPEIGPSEAAATLERIRASLAAALDRGPLSVTGSIGAVTFVTVPARVEDIVSLGDSRMYLAKAGGRNRVSLHVVGETGA